jgi:hypothetical protein
MSWAEATLASKPDERPNAIAAAYWRVLIRNLLEVEMLQHVACRGE